MGVIMLNGIAYGGDSTGGHNIINGSGSAMNTRENLQFTGYTKLTDDPIHNTTVVDNAPTRISWEAWQLKTEKEKEGTLWLVVDTPTGNLLAYGSKVVGGGGGGAAEGRIISFNTLVSDNAITIPDTNITDLSDDKKLQKATTVLFTRLPMQSDAQVFGEIEICMKCNISETNQNGNMRVEAFYVLDNESDRNVRPNPINHYTINAEDEYNIIRLFYLSPVLTEGDHSLAIKLLCTGGSAEIAISADNADYGDACMRVSSAGLPLGDYIEEDRPVSLDLTGVDTYTYLDTLHLSDYHVICNYESGKSYDVTELVNFSPVMDSIVGNDNFMLTASLYDLSVQLPITVDKIDHTELIGPNLIHGAHILQLSDYKVNAVLESGDKIDVTNECIFDPVMGTIITEETTLSATYAPLWTEEDPEICSLDFTIATIIETLTGGVAPNDTLIYTLYDDDYIRITGSIQEYGTYQAGYTYSTIELPAFTNLPEEYTLEFCINDAGGSFPYGTTYDKKCSINLPVQNINGENKGKIKKIINTAQCSGPGYSGQIPKISSIWNKLSFKGQDLITSEDLINIFQIKNINPYSNKSSKNADLTSAFEGCSSLTNLNFIGENTSYSWVYVYGIYQYCNMSCIFKDCSNLTDISRFKISPASVSGWGNEAKINLTSAFENCDKLRSISSCRLDSLAYYSSVANMFARSYAAYEDDPTFADTHILDADKLNWTIPNTWTKDILGIKEGTDNQIGFLFGTDIPQSETSLANKEYPLPQWYANLCEYTE